MSTDSFAYWVLIQAISRMQDIRYYC